MLDKLKDKEKDIYSRAAKIITIVFYLGMIPVLLMGFYDFPAADDYGFGSYAHIAWHNSHNLFKAIGGAFQTVYERFFGWQGTFSSILMMSLQPAVWSEKAYFLTVWIISAMLIASTLYFLHTVIVKIFKCDKSVWLGLSMLTLIFDIQCMIDKTQGLYWFNGAAHYVISRGFALILLALVLKALYVRDSKNIGACILAFWIGGCNLLTGLIMIILFFCGMAIYLYLKDYKRFRTILFPFVFLVLAFGLNVIAPGNYVRAESVETSYGAIKSIILSLYYCIDYFTTAWAGWEWIGFVLLAVPFIWVIAKKVCENTRFQFKCPLVIIVFGYLVLCAMFTPLLYAEGTPGTGRTFNIIFMDGILWLTFDLFYIFGWIIRLTEQKSLNKEMSEKNLKRYWISVTAVALVLALFYAKVDVNRYTATSAMASIVSGEGKAYAAECHEQIDTLKKYEGDKSQEVVVGQLKTHPYLTFYEDVEPEMGNWKNNLVVRFYQIGDLRVEKSE